MSDTLPVNNPKSRLPKMVNYELLQENTGKYVRFIGKILRNNGSSLVIQSPEGGKVMCMLNNTQSGDLSPFVEVIGRAMRDTKKYGNQIYLEQVGPIHNLGDALNLEYLNETIKLIAHPRFEKYYSIAGDSDDYSVPYNIV